MSVYGRKSFFRVATSSIPWVLCLQAEVCPRPVPRLGQPELSEAQRQVRRLNVCEQMQGKEASGAGRERVFGHGNTNRERLKNYVSWCGAQCSIRRWY